MFNWNTDTKKMKKADLEVWKLEQLINFGLNGEKIDLKSLKRNWTKLKLDPKRRRFMKLFVS